MLNKKPNVMLRKTIAHVRIFKLTLFIIVCLLTTFAVVYSFQIRIIEVVGDNVALNVNEKSLSKNLLFFPSDTITQEILSENPLVASVSFKKKLPHTLILTVTKRSPIARIRLSAGDIALAPDGTVLNNHGNFPDLPEIIFTAPETIHMGEKIDNEQVRVALEILAHNSGDVHFEVIRAFDAESVQAEMGNTTVLFSLKKPITESLSTLQSLLAGFRIKGINPSRIDLRFEKAVISLSNKFGKQLVFVSNE